jgi:hypothetical protein
VPDQWKTGNHWRYRRWRLREIDAALGNLLMREKADFLSGNWPNH